jgi:hypothetical protein
MIVHRRCRIVALGKYRNRKGSADLRPNATYQSEKRLTDEESQGFHRKRNPPGSAPGPVETDPKGASV